MALGESVWFAPLDPTPVTPQSAWDPAPDDRQIKDAAAFTVSLDTVVIPKDPLPHGLKERFQAIVEGKKDVLITSTCQLGAQPAVQRVHYYGDAHGFTRPFGQFVSETIYLTPDFDPPGRIHLLFEVFEAGDGPEGREGILEALNGVASKVGAVYPVILPYAFVGTNICAALNKLCDAVVPSEHSRLTQDINLYPAGRQDDIDLQRGRYIVLDQERDVTQFELQPDGRLITKGTDKQVMDFPYLIFRVDPGQEPTPDFVIGQRVATLLTQMQGKGNDPFQSTLGFVSDTLDGYTSFSDLRRYDQLMQKQKSGQKLSSEEQAVMTRIAGRQDLKGYLPH
jgi:hypothetical protein